MPTGRSSLRQSAKQSSWARIDDGVYGVALAIPVEMVSDFLSWERAHIKPAYPHDDRRIMLWMRARKMAVWATVPSLVQHGAPSASTLGHNNGRMVARQYIGDASALGIDWSRGAERPPRDNGSIHWRDLEAEALV